MDENQITRLAGVAQQLTEAGIAWGVFGGAAAKIYGAARPLNDIDILIPSDAGESVAAYFPDADLEYRADDSVAALELAGYEIIAGLTKYIDFAMDAEIIARLTTGKLLGLEVSVLSLEDNIALKAGLGRGPEVGKHDWADIAAMMQGCASLDWDYLHQRLAICLPEKAPWLYARLQRVWAGL